MALVNAITDKSDWQHKVFDDAIVAKWKAEALASNPPRNDPKSEEKDQSLITRWVTVTRKLPNANRNCRDYRVEVGGRNSPACVVEEKILLRMVDWAIAEVKYKAKILKQIDCIEALDGVWKSDTIINEELRRALDVAVWSLEDVPEINAKVIPLWDRVLSRVICPPMPPRVSDLSNSDMGFGEAIFDGSEQEEGENDNDYWRRLDEWEESDDRVDNRTVIEPEPGEYQTTAERLQGK
ncbi:MAG: hypothetical protein Q9186_005164 [Xanthomendoza sp. 1 TL-2023]